MSSSRKVSRIERAPWTSTWWTNPCPTTYQYLKTTYLTHLLMSILHTLLRLLMRLLHLKKPRKFLIILVEADVYRSRHVRYSRVRCTSVKQSKQVFRSNLRIKYGLLSTDL